MSEKNLPIKLVLQKETDIQGNTGGGKIKYFGEVTTELQNDISACELKVCTTKKPENPSVFLTLPVAHELSVLCMI